jgi:SAM-dependent methyltransferase/methyltransferase-like protein
MSVFSDNPYDEVPYPSSSYIESYPPLIAAIAALLDVAAPDVERCRVLEIGCASGGNIIPMAARLPEATFVGIDLSAQQVAVAQAEAAALGLANLTIHQMDILDVPEEFGMFDYIIAHGIYSWVPPAVRDGIMRICERHLAPDGLAYISYNTYPGWHMLGMIRDLMLLHTRDAESPAERAEMALELLDFLARPAPEKANPIYRFLTSYAATFREKLDELGPRRDSYLLHDALEEVNDPVYVHQFIAHAERFGLQYMAEAHFPNQIPSDVDKETLAAMNELSSGPAETEQFLDIVRGKTFRQTILCRQGVAVDRRIKPERLTRLFIASRAAPVADESGELPADVEQFRSFDGATLSTDHPVSKAAMHYLVEIWPRALSFAELLAEGRARAGRAAVSEQAQQADAQVLAANLLRAFAYSPNLVTLRPCLTPLMPHLSARPLVDPLVRRQAERTNEVTNRYHERVQLNPLCRALATLCDGTRDRDAIVAAIAEHMAEGSLSVEAPDEFGDDQAAIDAAVVEEIERNLQWLATVALLVG